MCDMGFRGTPSYLIHVPPTPLYPKGRGVATALPVKPSGRFDREVIPDQIKAMAGEAGANLASGLQLYGAYNTQQQKPPAPAPSRAAPDGMLLPRQQVAPPSASKPHHQHPHPPSASHPASTSGRTSSGSAKGGIAAGGHHHHKASRPADVCSIIIVPSGEGQLADSSPASCDGFVMDET